MEFSTFSCSSCFPSGCQLLLLFISLSMSLLFCLLFHCFPSSSAIFTFTSVQSLFCSCLVGYVLPLSQHPSISPYRGLRQFVASSMLITFIQTEHNRWTISNYTCSLGYELCPHHVCGSSIWLSQKCHAIHDSLM